MRLMLLFAAVAIYLMATLPAAAAANVRIIYPGGSQTVALPELAQRSVQFVSKGFGNYDVHLSISSALPIQQLLLFSCKAATPAACALSPQTLSPQATFSWSSLADQTSSYPQRANLLILAQLSTPKGLVWQGYWHRLERTASSQFFNLEQSADATVTAASLDAVPFIKRHLEDLNTIPTNPAHVSSVSFPSAISELRGAPPSFTQASSPSPLASFPAHDLLFPENAHPYTAVRNPTYTVGNGLCETSLGETSAASCSDCPCSSDSYCDASQACRSESAIALAATATATACSSPLSITATISNLPTAATATATTTLNSVQSTASCSKSGATLSCTSPLPACSPSAAYTGAFSVTLRFPDGATQRTKTLTAPLSFALRAPVCGNAVCETALGETSSSCCSDCACSGAQLCVADRCTAAPSGIAAVLTSFRTAPYQNGLPFSYALQSPTSAVSCVLSCTANSEPCSAECETSCAPAASGYACTATAFIGDYDSRKTYALTPTIIAESGGKQLASTLPSLTVGASFCGDHLPGAAETSASCCYDLGCPDAQYCDTAQRTAPSPTDACRALPALSLSPPTEAQFTSTNGPHQTVIEAVLADPPQSLSIDRAACSLPDTPGCRVTCAVVPPYGGATHLRCTMTIPAIPNHAAHPRFDLASRTILLPPGELSLSLRFNDGAATKRLDLAAALPAFTLVPTPACGDRVCDPSLGESASSCCIDCSCGADASYGDEFFCTTAATGSGRCISATTVSAQLTDPFPEPRCEIGVEGDCRFTRQPTIGLVVENAPDNLAISAATYSLGPLRCAPNQEECSLPCIPVFDDAGQVRGQFLCYPTLPAISSSEPGSQPVDLSVRATVSYTSAGATLTQDLSATKPFTLAREKSEVVLACEDQHKDLDSQLGNLKTARTFILTIFGLLTLLTAAACTCCAGVDLLGLCEALTIGCGTCAFGSTWLPCVGALAFGALAIIEGHIAQIEQQKAALCAAPDSDALRKEVDNTNQLVYSGAALVASAVCIFLPNGIGEAIGGSNFAAYQGAQAAAAVPAYTTQTINGVAYKVPNTLAQLEATYATTGVTTGQALQGANLALQAGQLVASRPSPQPPQPAQPSPPNAARQDPDPRHPVDP